MRSHVGFLSCLQDKTANLALSWSALKKPSWKLNFLYDFAIPSSSKNEKSCQTLEIIFGVFQLLETYCDCTSMPGEKIWGRQQ